MSVKESNVDNEYVTCYNQLLSDVMKEFQGNFAALASPTLSKQETVTALYRTIREGIKAGNHAPYPWRRLFEFLPRMILMFCRITYAALRYRVDSLPEGAVVFRTWLVPRSFDGSELKDDYFRQLPADLSANENVIISFTSRNIGLLNRFGKAQRDDNQIISYGLLDILDLIKLFWDYCSSALIQARQQYYLDGVDVTKFINRSLLLDYFELRSLEAYAEKYKCRKLAHHKIKAFVYVFENQSWEKICCMSLRPHRVKLVGYQSSGFSPIFLNFFPTEDDAKQQPMPDILLTVGNHFRKNLIEHGHYIIPLKTFAALRFSYMSKRNSYEVLSPNKQILHRILYAFPVHINQYPDTINTLIQVFGNSGIQIDLKLHPIYSSGDLNCTAELPDNFRIVTDVTMSTLRDTYDCVIFNDNSFGIEALLKGVKSYQFSGDGSFNDDRFMYFNLWKMNYQRSDLYELKNSINLNILNKDFNIQAVAEYINEMYRPYTKSAFENFLKLLNTPS